MNFIFLYSSKLFKLVKTVKNSVNSRVKFLSNLTNITDSCYNRYLNKKDQTLNKFKPENVPLNETSFFLFSGQGNQFVGMCKNLQELSVVRNMFKKASLILDYDLLDLCLNGPQSKLDQTIYCQPATFVSSLAAIEKLKLDYPGVVESCIGTAGFSLGELTALVFGGVLSFENGLRLVKIRAEAMQSACEMISSGLMTILFANDAKIGIMLKSASEYCKIKNLSDFNTVCSISNYLFPHCKVIGGNIDALQFIEQNHKQFGIKSFKKINVSGAFHTSLMNPAVINFEKALKKIHLNDPNIAIYSNYDAKPYLNKNEIIRKLPLQLANPVLWEQTMHTVFSNNKNEFPLIFECGPGKNLITILKHVNKKAYVNAKHLNVI